MRRERGSAPAGLCERCVHQQVVATRRSRFSLCLLSRSDPRFVRYPPLPVLSCSGFSPRDDAEPGLP